MEVGLQTPPPPPSNTSFLPALVLPVLSLVQPTSLSFPPLAAPSSHPPTTSALSAVHISALECLNNIFLSLANSPITSISKDVESGAAVWNSLWTALSLVGTQTGLGQERRQQMWEVAVGVLWGIGNVWKGLLVRLLRQRDTFLDMPGFRNPMMNRSSC